MENISRRDFIRKIITLPFFLEVAYAKNSSSQGIIKLPKKKYYTYEIEGKKKGKHILVVAGIHGNEEGSYYFARFLKHISLKRGKITVIPRQNFVSILAYVRGYNGDMNRKFPYVSPSDPDYRFLKYLKKYLHRKDIDLVLSLHDGYGFYKRNKRYWGECIVIDEVKYKHFELYKVAKFVEKFVNKLVPKYHKFGIKNTHTFWRNTPYKDMRKTLTYYSLVFANRPAWCFEVSKNLKSSYQKALYHFYMFYAFCKFFGIEFKESFKNLKHLLYENIKFKEDPEIILKVDEKFTRKYKLSKLNRKIIYAKKLSIENIYGEEDGYYPVLEKHNLNHEIFKISKATKILIKRDNKTLGYFIFKKS